MKYVRTKDGIKKVHKTQNDYLECYSVIGNNVPCYAMIHKNDVIKQGDDIEEVCDEFVEVGNHKPFLSEVRFEHWDKQTKNILIKQGVEVYGAIWTKHGLDYVAKMNKKGELELL